MGLILHRDSESGEIISVSNTDGTSSAYVDTVKVGAGKGPWAITRNGAEPNGKGKCTAFGTKKNSFFKKAVNFFIYSITVLCIVYYENMKI